MMVANELFRYSNWVCHRHKIPHDPNTGKRANCRRSETWSDFRTAETACWKYGFDGVGFEFSGTPFCGVDLDDCYAADGRLEPEAQCIVDTLNSFTEVSLSGSELHIIGSGQASREHGPPSLWHRDL